MSTVVLLIGTKLLYDKKIGWSKQKPHRSKYDEKTIDIVTKKECIRDGTSVYCMWCKHPFDGYIYRAVSNIAYEQNKKITYCYGTFCSCKCMFADIMDDICRIYEYRNPYYIASLYMITHTKCKIERDTSEICVPLKQAHSWLFILPFIYGKMDIDDFRKL